MIWVNDVVPAGTVSDTNNWVAPVTVPATTVAADDVVPMARHAVVPEQAIWVRVVGADAPVGSVSRAQVCDVAVIAPLTITGPVAVVPTAMQTEDVGHVICERLVTVAGV